MIQLVTQDFRPVVLPPTWFGPRWADSTFCLLPPKAKR